jgi:hypothetical protein
MIPKREILLRSQEWRLRPEVVEKDYVLGWMLAAITEHPVAGSAWVFKGGPCRSYPAGTPHRRCRRPSRTVTGRRRARENRSKR